MDCLFCNIVNQTEPAVVLYRDAVCTVILDVYPMSEGHALVLPNRHVALASELDPTEFQHLTRVWQGLLRAYRDAGVAQDGANLLLNDGSAANQHVPHVHLHLIPRKRGDTAKTLLSFATRMVNLFTGRKRHAALQTFAERVAPAIAMHLPAPQPGASPAGD
ncbi:MAG TPA: HIT family protein [Burkholderiaceae bacterium]|nr:HIT family protein [Burkholderiaceae bacterium]